MVRWCWAVLLALVAPLGWAQGFWLRAGEESIRDDLTLLVDEGILSLPVHAWPLPIDDVRRELARVRTDSIFEPALHAAWARLSEAASPPADPHEWRLHELSFAVGEAGALRRYDTLARDNGVLALRGGASSERWSLNIQAAFAFSPEDGKRLRLDGSDATIRIGNWLFSASQLDRWWGPGRFGSLILSTNARPMPQVSIDRIHSTRSTLPFVRWAGPWRFSAYLAAAEGNRPDMDNSLFMGMRLSFQPVPILEVGLSRTAQFCGQNPEGTRTSCGIEQVGRVLVGKDNIGFRGVDGENEPGNQMAGIDFRLTSPIRRLPVALYAQFIGEDSSGNSQSIIPNRFLGLMGAEGWWLARNGSTVRVRLEYSNTSCKWYSPQSNNLGLNCAYRQALFFAGYRYRNRNIGHTTDADAEVTSAQLVVVRPNGDRLAGHLQNGALDRYGGVDPYNPLTKGKSDFRSAEFSWEGRRMGQTFGVQLGYEQIKNAGAGRSGVLGFIQWRKTLQH